MTGKKRALGSDLKKVDRHLIQPHEYDEVPELTEEMIERGGGDGRNPPIPSNHTTRKKAAAKASHGKTVDKKRPGEAISDFPKFRLTPR